MKKISCAQIIPLGHLCPHKSPFFSSFAKSCEMKNFPFFLCFFCLGIGARKFINNSILICLDPIIFKKVIKQKRTESQKKLLFLGHLGVFRVINLSIHFFGCFS